MSLLNEPTGTSTILNLPPDALKVAHEAADLSAGILCEHFLKPLNVDYKSDASPVTVADRNAEMSIRKVIQQHFPDHYVLGEETGGDIEQATQSEYCWVIDPIDGTKAFVSGRPTFTTLIALLHHGVPVLGMINQPITQQRWVGVIGEGTTLNGVPVSVNSTSKTLSQCVLQATTPEMFVGLDAVLFRRVRRKVRATAWGGDAYAYAMLATGMTDVIVEADMKPWDYLALVPVIEGAGGVITDWIGAPLRLQSGGKIVAGVDGAIVIEVIKEMGYREENGFLDIDDIGKLGEDKVAMRDTVVREDPGEGSVESMTGVGVGCVEMHGFVVNCRMKSVNGKICDVNMKVPTYMTAFENELVGLVKRRAKRGRIQVNFSVQHSDVDTRIPLQVDTKATEDAARLLKEVANAAGMEENMVTLGDVLKFSEVFVREEREEDMDEVMPVVRAGLEAALNDLGRSRRIEGAVIEEDLVRRTKRIKELVDEIAGRTASRVVNERERLRKLCGEAGMKGMDEQRLEEAVVLYADRVDISEEIVRLRAHTNAFELSFLHSEEIGTRLTFMTQEMKREATTMADKCADVGIAQLTVLVREELEKIREQVCNIR